MGNSDRKPGLIKRLWKWWRTPSRLALGTLLLIGFVGGIVFWGGFNTGMEKPIPKSSALAATKCVTRCIRNTWIPCTTTTVAASVRPVRIVTFRTSLCQR